MISPWRALAASPSAPGTGSSNPSPSSRESDSNLTFRGRRVELEGGNLGGGQEPVIVGCRPGRRTRKVFRYRANRRRYLCRAIFQSGMPASLAA